MKILVDCRCLNYPFLTGVNAYTIRLLHCLSIIKLKNQEFKITAIGLKSDRMRELMNQFPFLLNMFDNHITLAKYLNYQDSPITQSNWFHKLLEVKLISKNWFSKNLNSKLERYDYIILPQPRLLKLHPDSKLITIFHDIFSILNNQKQLPQSLIFNRQTCQTLVNRSHKIIAGSISTCQDINKTFFDQTNFNNPKIRLIYPALPDLQELQVKFIGENLKNKLPLAKGLAPEGWCKQGLLAEAMAQEADWGYKSDITKIKCKIQNPPSNPYILAISGIEPRKNWQNLLLAHKHLQKKYNWNLTLILSGSVIDQKYYNKLLRLVKEQQIQNVVWQINITDDEKNQLIKNCEFVVYPSFYEGFGFPILEAFEYNKVVVTSRISSLPEIGKDACVYANPFNYVSIANCMYLLIIDKNFKLKIEINIAKIKSQYCWDQMTQELENLLV